MSFGVSLQSLTSNEGEKSFPLRNKISPFGRNDREFQFISEIFAKLYGLSEIFNKNILTKKTGYTALIECNP